MNYSLLKKPINGLIIAFVSAGLLSACGGGSDDSLSRAPSSVNGDGGLMPKALNTAAESSGPAGEMSDKKQAELSVSEADEQALLADNDDESSDMFSEATDAKLAGLEESGGTKKALIIGGSNAKITPKFVAAIHIVFKDNSSEPCSGSLIHRQWILTAAHCFRSELTSINIHLGHNDKKMPDTKYKYTAAKTDGAFNIFIHPKYTPSPRSILYDIALIKLDRPVPDYVARPIRLGASATSTTVGGKSSSLFYGYGMINNKGDYPSILQEFALAEIFTVPKCLLVSYFNLTLDQLMCFQGSEEKTLGKGDSGGPVIPINGATGQSSHRLAGVINVAAREHPFDIIAARVYYYRDWIHKTIGAGCDELQYCYVAFSRKKTESTHHGNSFKVPENSSRYTIFAVNTPILTKKNSSTLVKIQLEQQMPNGEWSATDYLNSNLVTDAGSLRVSHYIEAISGSPSAINNRVYRWAVTFKNATHPDSYIDVAWEYGHTPSGNLSRRLLGNNWQASSTLFDGITAMYERDGKFYPQLPGYLYDGQSLRVRFQKGSIIRDATFIVGKTQDRVDLTPDRHDDFNVWTETRVSSTGQGVFIVKAEFKEGIPICQASLSGVRMKWQMDGGPLTTFLGSEVAKGTTVTAHYWITASSSYMGTRDFQIGENAVEFPVQMFGRRVKTWANVEPNGCYKFGASLY